MDFKSLGWKFLSKETFGDGNKNTCFSFEMNKSVDETVNFNWFHYGIKNAITHNRHNQANV